VRPGNEDSFLELSSDASKGALFAVADGLGGLEKGEAASGEATAFLGAWFGSLEAPAASEDLAEAVREINARIHSIGRAEGISLGTTLTVCAFAGGKLEAAHVGDSRLYRVRDGRLASLTRDHAAGRHVLTKAVGTRAFVEPDVFRLPVKAGDRYLLATDGLHGYVNDEAIDTAMRGNSPEACVRALTEAAVDAGAPDNVTVVVVFAEEI